MWVFNFNLNVFVPMWDLTDGHPRISHNTGVQCSQPQPHNLKNQQYASPFSLDCKNRGKGAALMYFIKFCYFCYTVLYLLWQTSSQGWHPHSSLMMINLVLLDQCCPLISQSLRLEQVLSSTHSSSLPQVSTAAAANTQQSHLRKHYFAQQKTQILKPLLSLYMLILPIYHYIVVFLSLKW